jgi:ABC-2 type transport system ATP-binding protein
MELGPALCVDRVVKSFSTIRAVDDLSFEVRHGEIFGFLGPNGAGKTTTLRMIMGITRPDEGRVTFSGQPRHDPRKVGYLPEERGLFEEAPVQDVLEYLGMLRGLSRRAARAAASDWLERLALTDHARHKVHTLSKGNQQKVQLAGAVLHQPTLAVLDEPFSGLDPLNQELFLDLIREFRTRGVAVLISAHQLQLVERVCDRFLLIAKGREVLGGTLESMRREATGGRTDVLKLDLRPRRRDAPPEAVCRLLLEESGCEPRIETAEDMLTAFVSWPEGRDLGPLLASLSSDWALERVEMRPMSLHEIYVLRVGGKGVLGDAAQESAVSRGAYV